MSGIHITANHIDLNYVDSDHEKELEQPLHCDEAINNGNGVVVGIREPPEKSHESPMVISDQRKLIAVTATFSVFSLILTIALLLNVKSSLDAKQTQPNIVFVIVDGLGWNDVSWNNPDVQTPTLEALGKDGVILNHYYVQPTGTATRAALLTGRYPFKIGLQHINNGDTVRDGLPRNRYILSELLKKLNYTTHMVGKWDLGICHGENTPLYRGFDSFYGHYFESSSSFTHSFTDQVTGLNGLNLYDHTGAVGHENGTGINELLLRRIHRITHGHIANNPLFMLISVDLQELSTQESERFNNASSEIENEELRNRYGMISGLDKFVDDVKNHLIHSGLWKDTLLVFSSASGGDIDIAEMSNSPLKGGKGSVFEGGTRVPAFIHGRSVVKRRYTNNEIIHITDWLPTLLSMIGEHRAAHDVSLDGVNVLDTIKHGSTSPRNGHIYNIDLENPIIAAIRHGDYKLIETDNSTLNVDVINKGNHLVDYNVSKPVTALDASTKQLYNVKDDPKEEIDLFASQPEKVIELHQKLIDSLDEVRAPLPSASEDDLNRSYYNGVWVPGRC